MLALANSVHGISLVLPVVRIPQSIGSIPHPDEIQDFEGT